ncbi:hypothetical protein [Taklimakanibacter deserti]|uniref:hypothetical protein n=1 Tax=Taklimakanibacter deserti TaxID=2267839 RepID=UPI000E6561B8
MIPGLSWLAGKALDALGNFLARVFKDWRRDQKLEQLGEERQAAKERDELDRQVAITEEEDETARTDSDDALRDELKRPL